MEQIKAFTVELAAQEKYFTTYYQEITRFYIILNKIQIFTEEMFPPLAEVRKMPESVHACFNSAHGKM